MKEWHGKGRGASLHRGFSCALLRVSLNESGENYLALALQARYPALFVGSKAAKNASISAPESDSQSSSFCVSAVSHSA